MCGPIVLNAWDWILIYIYIYIYIYINIATHNKVTYIINAVSVSLICWSLDGPHHMRRGGGKHWLELPLGPCHRRRAASRHSMGNQYTIWWKQILKSAKTVKVEKVSIASTHQYDSSPAKEIDPNTITEEKQASFVRVATMRLSFTFVEDCLFGHGRGGVKLTGDTS